MTMEINEDGFVEDLLGLRREAYSTDELNSLFCPTISTWSGTGGGGFEGLDSAALCYQPPFSTYSSTVINPSTSIGDYLLLEDDSHFSTCIRKTTKVKRVEGQPSKNLMAERRRRKRLNDRLSMLRSVVPNITKMDRTSILGDTIDYMKKLLERINKLKEDVDDDADASNQFSVLKDVKPTDILVRNSPKFDVERKNSNTRIEICCAGKPGLLLSTITTLEALGLEIQQCVISCFSDFSLQASCSQGSLLGSEDIKQALFRNAGYGGRCL